MPFVKGKSGNPGGRPKGRPSAALQYRAFAQSVLMQPQYRRNVSKMFRDTPPNEIPAHWVQLLHYYAVGKPAETMQHTGADTGPIRFTMRLGFAPQSPDSNGDGDGEH